MVHLIGSVGGTGGLIPYGMVEFFSRLTHLALQYVGNRAFSSLWLWYIEPSWKNSAP